MQTDSALKVLESGVDWLTVTAPRGTRADEMIARAEGLLHQSEGAGNRISMWKGSGYHGRTSGGISLGVGREGSIVTLKSREAYRSAESFLGKEYRVTRLDLQTTCFDKRQVAARAEIAYHLMQDSRKKAGRRISARLWLGTGGGQSLYLGSPKSDVIARLYDKGIEQRLAEAGACWRWEVQYRRRFAKLQAERLYQSESKSNHIASTVTRFFKDRGVVVPRVAKVPAKLEAQYETLCPKRDATDSERALRWLSTLVAPSVKRLIDSGYRAEVLRVLGLDE